MNDGVIILRIFSWLKTLVALLVFVVAASYLIYSSDWFQKKFIYPFPYREIVFKYAEANDIDPFLVAAVIRTESKFVPQAKSSKGAIGLMQMMPETGQWVANQTEYDNFTAASLNDPDISIRFGTWYLASLKKEFRNNEVLMLAAYNGGRGNVKQWMSQYGWTASFKDIDQIPFKETREYVKKVQQARMRYRDLYGR
jgi:soluble lytic murein transglycosylase